MKYKFSHLSHALEGSHSVKLFPKQSKCKITILLSCSQRLTFALYTFLPNNSMVWRCQVMSSSSTNITASIKGTMHDKTWCCCQSGCHWTQQAKTILKAWIYCSRFNLQNHTVVFKQLISIYAPTWLSPLCLNTQNTSGYLYILQYWNTYIGGKLMYRYGAL